MMTSVVERSDKSVSPSPVYATHSAAKVLAPSQRYVSSQVSAGRMLSPLLSSVKHLCNLFAFEAGLFNGTTDGLRPSTEEKKKGLAGQVAGGVAAV